MDKVYLDTASSVQHHLKCQHPSPAVPGQATCKVLYNLVIWFNSSVCPCVIWNLKVLLCSVNTFVVVLFVGLFICSTGLYTIGGLDWKFRKLDLHLHKNLLANSIHANMQICYDMHRLSLY